MTRGYEQGQVEYLTFLIAQQTYVQTTLANVNALRELQTAAALFEGQLLTGSLEKSWDSHERFQIATIRGRR